MHVDPESLGIDGYRREIRASFLVYVLVSVPREVDSIPAVFGVTTDPFIAFSSNAFALLGLRALYPVVPPGNARGGAGGIGEDDGNASSLSCVRSGSAPGWYTQGGSSAIVSVLFKGSIFVGVYAARFKVVVLFCGVRDRLRLWSCLCALLE